MIKIPQLIAIITAILSFLNYSFWTSNNLDFLYKLFSVIAQGLLLIVTLFATISYSGKKLTFNYVNPSYKIFTIRYSILIISLLGNLSIFIVLLLNFMGKINVL